MIIPNKKDEKLITRIGEIPTSFMESLSYYEQNLCLCNKINEISDFINNILEQKITEYIDNVFNNIFLNTMYDAESETLIMFLDRKEN